MIARIWRGLAAQDRTQAYIAYVNATGVAEYREMPGCRLSAILSRVLDPGDARNQESGIAGRTDRLKWRWSHSAFGTAKPTFRASLVRTSTQWSCTPRTTNICSSLRP